jgi:hypothetical protein
MMVADREVVAESTLPMEGVTRMAGLTTIQGIAIALMARVIPIILGTDLSRRHAPPRAIPVTW